MRYSSFVVLFVSILIVVALPVSALDVVYVVRHAQKNQSPVWSDIGNLRPLSPKGARCAARLSKIMENRGIAAVYASETTRTTATGVAVSTTRDGVEVIGDDTTLKPTAEFVEQLKERHLDDKAILLVGHSNTVDDLVVAFRPDVEQCLEKFRLAERGAPMKGVPETQYGDIWRLKIGADQTECRGVNREKIGRVGDDDCSVP